MSRTQNRDKRGPQRQGQGESKRIASGVRRNWAVGAAIAGVVVVAAVIAVATSGGDTETTTPSVPVVATGAPLSPLTDPLFDPAAGTSAPTLTGPAVSGTADGDVVEISANGEPTVVLFVAHWCSHCQAEVPRVVALHAAGETEGVRLLAVATANDPNRPNYPAAGWLASEGWPTPVLLDDAAVTAAKAFGVSGFPFITVLDGGGNVVLRTSGELGDDGLRRVFELARTTG